jgi:hypothetical protein
MSDLLQLSKVLDNELSLIDNDLTPRYLPNQLELRGLSDVCLNLLVRYEAETLNVKFLRNKKKSKACLSILLAEVNSNIKQNHKWSFWHYASLCLVTCFAYAKLLEQNKHKTIDLASQETWNIPNSEVATLAINYVAGRLYPDGLSIVIQLMNSDKYDIDTLCRFLTRKIGVVSGASKK